MSRRKRKIEQVPLRSNNFDPITDEDIREMNIITVRNTNYLNATSKHYSALAESSTDRLLKRKYNKIALHSAEKARQEKNQIIIHGTNV